MRKRCTDLIVAMLIVVMGAAVTNYDFTWAEENPAGEQTIINNIEEIIEEEMEFLYIESSELESPGTQNIAVAWNEDMSNIAEFVLVYSDGNGNTYELKERKRTDNSVLFAKEFYSSETGTYKINSMKYSIEGVEEEQTLIFDDVEIKADFTVVNNQEDEVTETVSNNTATTSTDVSALSDDVEALLTTANVKSKPIEGRNVIIVIDPGHGGSDPGACSNGLQEKDLNLKISKYFRDELKEYKGVEVYMTRETDKDAGEIAARVEYAAKRNADLLVSVHINSTGSGAAKGAEVWAPNENYNSKVYNLGQGVSAEIQKELVALGLANRGVKVSYSKDNTRYTDGSLADYYGIIRESKEKGFTGIIIEHAFIDNAGDAAFLKSESNLKALGVADATGVAEYFGLSKEEETTSVPDEATPAAVDTALKDAGFSYAEYTAPDQDTAYLRGFEPGSDVSVYVDKLNAIEGISEVSYTDINGTAMTSGKVATGQKISLKYGDKNYIRIVVVAGDVNGDGEIYPTDYMKIKNHIMNFGEPLSGAYKCAADTNGDAMIYPTDYVKTKNHIMGTRLIDQNLEFKVYELN